jgi:hypothetical protein
MENQIKVGALREAIKLYVVQNRAGPGGLGYASGMYVVLNSGLIRFFYVPLTIFYEMYKNLCATSKKAGLFIQSWKRGWYF